MHVWNESLATTVTRLQQRALSVTDMVTMSIQNIKAIDGHIRAFLSIDEEGAYAQARQWDDATDVPRDQLLFGIPMALKDNIMTRGMKTTCASRMLENFIPVYDATVTTKLRHAHAVLIGKVNMDEFAMGGSNENSAFHPTHNPWNTQYVPGGSSGGSAASVAAREVLFALGSDTGGSIRQPAAYCGVVGLKPTYGLVSRYGLVAFASSLDQIGPLTRTVDDAAVVLQAIAGHDRRDATSADVPIPNYTEALHGDVRGLKIALPKEYFGEGLDPVVKQAVLDACAQLERLGATCSEVSMPHNEYAVATYYVLASSEASSNLARYDGVRFGMRAAGKSLFDMYVHTRSKGFGDEVKRRIMLGTYALSSGYEQAFYTQAQKVRTLIKQDFDRVFASYDVIIGPTAPTAAFALGSQVHDPLTMYLNDTYSIPMSLAGVPALSLPCGYTHDHLPIGMQIIGNLFAESTVLRVAHAFEQATDFHRRVPPIVQTMLQGGGSV